MKTIITTNYYRGCLKQFVLIPCITLTHENTTGGGYPFEYKSFGIVLEWLFWNITIRKEYQ